jgi:hypothetical protein
MPPHCGTVVTGWILAGDQHCELERVCKMEASELPGGQFGVEELTGLDRALKAGVCCPLRRHNVRRWDSA